LVSGRGWSRAELRGPAHTTFVERPMKVIEPALALDWSNLRLLGANRLTEKR
jgi:hypothetical protein